MRNLLPKWTAYTLHTQAIRTLEVGRSATTMYFHRAIAWEEVITFLVSYATRSLPQRLGCAGWAGKERPLTLLPRQLLLCAAKNDRFILATLPVSKLCKAFLYIDAFGIFWQSMTGVETMYESNFYAQAHIHRAVQTRRRRNSADAYRPTIHGQSEDA
jgi:hypothetical protein